MIKDIDVDVKIHGTNREKYERVLGRNLTNGNIVSVSQRNVLPSSRLEVECECDMCGEDFLRKRVNIKSETTTCSTKCRDEWLKENNPNPKKKKRSVNCTLCGEEFNVNEAKYKSQERFFCSRDCYANFRSEYYHGDKIYNYNSLDSQCDNCSKEIVVSRFIQKRNNHVFCTPECYHEFRSDNYVEHYYIPHLRESFGETEPERLVREWLEEHDIKYEAEVGFLRKYYCDFYLYEFKVILEVYGDYWHVNPNVYDVYSNNPKKKGLHKQQLDFIKHDKEKEEDFMSRGLDYRVIWEKDVYDDIDHHMQEILNDKLESVTTGRNTPTGKKVQSEHTHII